jgi:glycosyltransferase involved in cell wall biosynthesis
VENEEELFTEELPLVSVIIPCYNGEKTVFKCLNSVFIQNYTPLEVIVIDDASTDKTYSLLSSAKIQNEKENCKSDKHLKIIKHERNIGLAATYNHGLKVARGNFIMFLHQDCQLESPEWLNKAIRHFVNPKVAMVTGKTIINIMNLNHKIFAFLKRIVPQTANNLSIEPISFSEGKCDLYRKDALVSIGPFPSQKFRISGEDQWTSYALRKKGWKLLRDNSLIFKQEIPEDIRSNLKKEFTFGKTQAGLALEYGFFQLKELDSYSKYRAINRMSKLLFTFSIISFFLLGIILKIPELLFLSGLILFLRIFYFLIASSRSSVIPFSIIESFVVSILGVITDFIYFIGFMYGLCLYVLTAKVEKGE